VNAPAGTVVLTVDPAATAADVSTEPIFAVPPTAHHSNSALTVALASTSLITAESCGVTVLTTGRLAPVAQVVAGVVERVPTVGYEL
jgi:hypothetical protein